MISILNNIYSIFLNSAAFETGWGGFINKEGWNNTWVNK